ncbi:MAG: AIR synthase [Bacteroidetes bacterium]|nr:MAG: AIR synthase [Bacteroidota bacterium]
MKLEAGKLGSSELTDIICSQTGATPSAVRTGPSFGVDVSLVDIGNGRGLVQTSDPLSYIPSLGLEESAWLSVHLMANDMATSGLAPQFGQFVLNLPAHLSESDFKTYWSFIHKFSSEIGLAITGGHTGFFEGVNSTIAGGGTLTSIGDLDKIRLSNMGSPNDELIVTKSAALSSTSILAMSFPETVVQKLGTEIQREASSAFFQTSSLKDAQIAVGQQGEHAEVKALHDVTEGGVIGALIELATASSCGLQINLESLPLEEAQEAICHLFSLNPFRCVGAGSMIIACAAGTSDSVIQRLKNAGISASMVGVLKEQTHGLQWTNGDESGELEYQDRDPYWEAFSHALKNGWR